MGGMSTDSAKRKKMWDEDIMVYTGYGFKPVTLTKLMKMAWKGAAVCPLSLRTAKFLGWRIMRSMPVFVGWNRLGR